MIILFVFTECNLISRFGIEEQVDGYAILENSTVGEFKMIVQSFCKCGQYQTINFGCFYLIIFLVEYYLKRRKTCTSKYNPNLMSVFGFGLHKNEYHYDLFID